MKQPPKPEGPGESGYDWITLLVALLIAVMLAVVTLDMWGHG